MVELAFPDLARRLAAYELPPVDVVVGVGRGGIVPASLAAYRLGCHLVVLPFNYRDDLNAPRYATPRRLGGVVLPDGARRVLLVDDVAVSGRTLRAARAYLEAEGLEVTTFVLKGTADHVLLPEVADCVAWPWKPRAPRLAEPAP